MPAKPTRKTAKKSVKRPSKRAGGTKRKAVTKGARKPARRPMSAGKRPASRAAVRKATPVVRKTARAVRKASPAVLKATPAAGKYRSGGASKIVPHLWFDKEAREAAAFYTPLFPDSGIDSTAVIRNTPSGDCDLVSFHLAGQDFMAISAGPVFKFNPSISFILNFDPSQDKEARRRLDATWNALVKGGQVMMELQEYPHSKRYGWLQDRYGVSWQLLLTDPSGERRPFIVPALMFTGKNAGRAEEAIQFYTSTFKDSRRGTTAHYPKAMESEKGGIMYADFQLEGQWFALMESRGPHAFTFNEALSLLVCCEDQKEIDGYWAKLSAMPEAEQCGWLKDKFGVSWQIAPKEMDEMLSKGTHAQVDRVTKAFLPMKKFDVAALRRAYAGT